MSTQSRKVIVPLAIVVFLVFFACTGGSIGTDNPSNDFTENGSSSSATGDTMSAIAGSSIAGSSMASMPSSGVSSVGTSVTSPDLSSRAESSSSIVASWDPSSSTDSLPKSSESKDTLSSAGVSSSRTLRSSSSWSPFKEGLSYGEFTDNRNNKVYKTIVLGGLANIEYMAQNLDIGEMVAGNTNQADAGKIEKFCYNDDPANCEKYGGLYQWSEAMGFPSACNNNLTGSAECSIFYTRNNGVEHQGICPNGWHIMNGGDWNTVWNGGSQTASRLRSEAWNGSNMTGFSALPGGAVNYLAEFEGLTKEANFWQPDENAAATAAYMYISNTATSVSKESAGKKSGLSIRCVKDY